MNVLFLKNRKALGKMYLVKYPLEREHSHYPIKINCNRIKNLKALKLTVISYLQYVHTMKRVYKLHRKLVGFEPPELIIRPFTALHFAAFMCTAIRPL